MSRVLKRPMFRKGGPAMEGVMNGIEDRTNFQNGNLVQQAEQKKELLKQLVGQPSPGSALTNFLLQFGPAIASRPTTGNILADIAGAAQAPSANLAKQLAAEDQFQRQLGLMAAKSVIAPKTNRMFADQTRAAKINAERNSIMKTEQFTKLKNYATDIAINNVDFRSKNPDKKYISRPSFEDGLKNVPNGAFYYDPFKGNHYKKISENNVVAVDINGNPLAD
jgi:hypothetical protein